MNQKKRKSLNDALAEQFVFGSQSEVEPEIEIEAEPEPEPEPQPKVQQVSKTPAKTKKKESSVTDRLQPIEREATVRITVDLPESLHKRLSIYCATSGNKKAEVVRVLLDEFLSEQGIKED